MLELGGNGPLIVTRGRRARTRGVDTAIVGKFLHQGQMCIASIASSSPTRFTTRSSGASSSWRALWERGGRAIRIVNRSAHQPGAVRSVAALVDAREAEGADVSCSARRRTGWSCPPACSIGVTPDMAIARRRSSDPWRRSLRATDDDDAVRIANDTEYGLTSGVLCRDLAAPSASRTASRPA